MITTTNPTKAFLDAVSCDNATDGIDANANANRLMIVERFHGEPIYMAEYEDQPTEYSWDGEDDITYSTAEEVRDAIILAERSAEALWAIKPGEF